MSQELLRIVDSIAREKNIEAETVIVDLELAMVSAIRKANTDEDEISVAIDRESGEIAASLNGEAMSVRALGRIAAQTAKQVMIQRIREAERDSLFEEYAARKGQIVTGRVSRWEGGSLVVEMERCEALLPRSEQIPGDSHQPEERIRAMIYEVREQPGAVKIILSRTHPDFIRALFELEVPEVSERIIEIRALAREAGYRTKVAVNSLDPKVDAVGACVGIRGSRIRNIVDELGGEKIDIVRWNDSSKTLIANALKPAEVAEIALCFELGRATVVVADDQLSLAIGKRGQNVRLAARLTGWDIDILTPGEFNLGLDRLEKTLRKVEGIDATMVDQIQAMGMVSVLDIDEVGANPFVNELNMDLELAKLVVATCTTEARKTPPKDGKKGAPPKDAPPPADAPAGDAAPADAAPADENAPAEDAAVVAVAEVTQAVAPVEPAEVAEVVTPVEVSEEATPAADAPAVEDDEATPAGESV